MGAPKRHCINCSLLVPRKVLFVTINRLFRFDKKIMLLKIPFSKHLVREINALELAKISDEKSYYFVFYKSYFRGIHLNY